MSKNLLIVESPKKARTIQKFLKGNWIVRASYGHVRQLARDGEDQLGFDLVGDEVRCRYVAIDPRTLKNLSELKKLAQQASQVFLATDQDREGEGISFHLKEALGLRSYQRVTYKELDEENFALYELIWRRAMASQCNPAQINKTKITSKSGEVYWLAKGQVLRFAGYMRYWNDFGGNSELPPVQEGNNLTLESADSEKRMTQPPPRYSEAKLVQVMERQGIGRPSTYSSTVKTLKDRSYVKIVKGKLQATELGLSVDRFQSSAFPELVESKFTAEMEERLDAIAQGKQDWQKYLTSWNREYFAGAVERAKSKAGAEASEGQGNNGYAPREKSTQKCPKCGDLMDKIPSKSKKLARPYFLKCKSKACDVVMFYNKSQKAWVEPGQKREETVPKISEHLCPVCNAFLAEKTYQKNGQSKKMLVCSTNKKDKKHKDVVFFQSKGHWWSRKFGELE